MARSRSRLNGFTLIELLLATTILFLLLSSAMFAYRLYDDSWKRRLSDVDYSFAHYKKIDLFNNAIAGVSTYMVQPTMQSNELSSMGFYFLGREEGFTAVTQTPWFDMGTPAVIRVFRESNPQGGSRLVYEQASLNEQMLLSADQNLNFTHRVVIFEDLRQLTFRYFGLDTSNDFESDEKAHVFAWFESYDGMQIKQQPDQIEIELDNIKWYFQIQQRSFEYKSRVLTDI